MASRALLASAALCLSIVFIQQAESRRLTGLGGCQEQLPHGGRDKRQAGEPLHIELLLVADHSLFLYHGGDLARVHRYCHSVAKHADRVYASLNIRVTLVDVVVWSRGDEMEVVSDANVTLHNFARYRRSSRALAAIPHDSAHLLTMRNFDKGTIGMGFVLESVCAHAWSCGVQHALEAPARAASALAHELGHNLGMHDERAGACRASCRARAGCVMDTGAGDAWSGCSRRVVERYFGSDGDGCLRNPPRKHFQLPAPADPAPKPSSVLPAAAQGADDNDISASNPVDLSVLLVMDETTTRRERAVLGNSEKHYGLSLIKAVNSYFIPLGVKVHIADVVTLSLGAQNSIVDVRSVNRTLANFRNHMQTQRDTINVQYHVAILMSHAVYISKYTRTTGSSWIGGACSAGHEYGVVSTDQSSRSAAITLAHELGHLLGLRHDEDTPAAPVRDCPDGSARHIMATVIGDHTDALLSRCSLNAWNDGLKTKFGNCLRYPPSKRASFDESNEVEDLDSNTAVTEKKVVVRVLLVVGESTYRKYGGEQYCNRLMRTVRSYYLALGIDLQSAGVKYINGYVEQGLVDKSSAGRTLDAFNAFAGKLHHATEAQFHIAVLLSDHSYPYVNKGLVDTRYTIKGRSIPGEVCRPASGNAIVSSEQGSEALTALTLAHELGHVLGMSDEAKRVEGVPSCPHGGRARIMSGALRSDLLADWSQCSRDTWATFYRSEAARCLWDESTPKSDKRPQHSWRAPSDQIQDQHIAVGDTKRAPTAPPPTRIQRPVGSSRGSVAPTPKGRKLRMNVLLVFGNSTLAARGVSAYSRGRDLIEAVDSYFAPLGVRVELAGWARLSSSVESSMNQESLYDFQRIVKRGKLKKGLPKHYVAILISHLFSSPDKLGMSFSAGACSSGNYMGAMSSRHEDWRSKVALAQQLARLLGIGDEELMKGVRGCPEPPSAAHIMAAAGAMKEGQTRWSECSIGTLKAARERSLLDCLV